MENPYDRGIRKSKRLLNYSIMCMYVEDAAKIRRLFHSVKCYKVVRVVGGGRFISPYRLSVWYRVGRTSRMEFPRDFSIEYETISNHYIVNTGLHTFANLQDALAERECWNKEHPESEFVVLKCRIPIFARFVSGVFVGCANYASDRLKVIKVVEVTKDHYTLENRIV